MSDTAREPATPRGRAALLLLGTFVLGLVCGAALLRIGQHTVLPHGHGPGAHRPGAGGPGPGDRRSSISTVGWTWTRTSGANCARSSAASASGSTSCSRRPGGRSATS